MIPGSALLLLALLADAIKPIALGIELGHWKGFGAIGAALSYNSVLGIHKILLDGNFPQLVSEPLI